MQQTIVLIPPEYESRPLRGPGKLAVAADVVVQNYRPGVVERLGVGYDEVRRLNPKLIDVSASGYGRGGLYRDLAGQDLLLQALTGLAYITGDGNGPPTAVGCAAVDHHSAALLAMGVLAALVHRLHTGEGQHVEITMVEGALDLHRETVSYHPRITIPRLTESTARKMVTSHFPCLLSKRYSRRIGSNSSTFRLRSIASPLGWGTIRGVAKQFGVHRRIVRQALASAIPPERKRSARVQPKLDPVKAFMDKILRVDQQMLRKQRHTAHSVWVRVVEERPEAGVAESTVRHCVCPRKRELGLAEREMFVPQTTTWGSEAQVDWYEGVAEIAGERRPVSTFSMRSMASGEAFHRTYYHATQQAFLEGHEFAFGSFSGVFGRLRYDNLGSAVRKILRVRGSGKRRGG